MENKVEQVDCGDRIEYRLNGVAHREDGPAILYKEHRTEEGYLFGGGEIVYCKNGKIHRDEGPAYIDSANYSAKWYANGVELSEEEEELAADILRGKYFDKLPLYLNHPTLKIFAEKVLRDGPKIRKRYTKTNI